MTFPGQASLRFFERLEEKQIKLWNDRKDMGIVLTDIPNFKSDKGLSTCKEVARDCLKHLMDLYAYNLSRDKDRRSSVTSIFIPFEFVEKSDGNAMTGYLGVDLHVAYSKSDNSLHPDREYLCISIKHIAKTHAQANANGPLFKMDVETSNNKAMTDAKPMTIQLAEMEYEESAILAEQGRSNPNAWAEAVQNNFESKIKNFCNKF